MWIRVMKTFTASTGDIVKKDTILVTIKEIGDYSLYKDQNNGNNIYLNKNEEENYTEPYIPHEEDIFEG